MEPGHLACSRDRCLSFEGSRSKCGESKSPFLYGPPFCEKTSQTWKNSKGLLAKAPALCYLGVGYFPSRSHEGPSRHWSATLKPLSETQEQT